MTWRDQYRVHPAADVFPMMSDTELAELGEDISANGLRSKIIFTPADENEILDGRNRLEAMERAGFDISPDALASRGAVDWHLGDPVAYVISSNIHRRHLTKQQQADLIVAAIKAGEKPLHVDEVSKGGRSKVNKTKAKAVTEAKKHGISKSTVERSFAKAEGKLPAAKRYTPRPLPKPKSGKPVTGLDAVRRHYLDLCAAPDVNLDEEQRVIVEAFREIAGKRIAAAEADLAIPDFLKRAQEAGHV